MVVSAISGVTDALLEIASVAVRGVVDTALRAVAALRAKHIEAARSLLSARGGLDNLLGIVATSFGELEHVVRGLAALRELTSRTTDYVVARGERLSARLVVATLGRGGSDLSATLLARALGAREVSLWKDVPGLLTADPRHVPEARVVLQLHVREAAELAYYGARVLHPPRSFPSCARTSRSGSDHSPTLRLPAPRSRVVRRQMPIR